MEYIGRVGLGCKVTSATIKCDSQAMEVSQVDASIRGRRLYACNACSLTVDLSRLGRLNLVCIWLTLI
jgi:hypothetical protein